jgi:carbonic anhydrase
VGKGIWLAICAIKAKHERVIGHSKCGAVDAAVKAVKDGKEFPGNIAQELASNPLTLAIGIKEADYSLGLLKRLD